MKPLLTVITFLFLSALSYSQEFNGNRSDIDAILRKSESWSENYVNGSIRGLAELYVTDGKILPNGSRIIEGRDAIAEKFKLKDGYSTISHVVNSEEITITGEYAFDYGYYEGITENEKEEQSGFKGKYVIIWKKINGEWLIYVDIWNSVLDD